MLRVYLLGSPQAFEDERPLSLPTPDKVLALWAYLLLKRQHPLPRDYLAYNLWPDLPEEEARANLRRHLHLLRKQLPLPAEGIPWILARHNTVQWNPDAPCWLDVALLEEFDGTTADEGRWAEVMDCYRGDLLTGFYEDWVLAERTRWQQCYLSLLEQRIVQQKVRGDWSGVIHTTRRLLAHDPLREEPYRHLMESYYHLGDRAAALREFERCEAMLRIELDAGPMPETLALRDRILAGEGLSPSPMPVVEPGHFPLPLQPTAVAGPVARPGAGFRFFPRLRWWPVAMVLLAFILAGVLLAALWRSSTEPITVSISGLAAVQDTWLNSLSPNLPYDPEWGRNLYAVYPQVHLSYWGYPYDRLLIRFDLGQLPVSTQVEQATLHLYLEPFFNESLPEARPATISAFRLLVPWEPDTATFNAPWSQPGLVAGVDYTAEPLSSGTLHSSDWVALDVTAAVQYWLAHPDRNFGLMIMITAAPQGAHYWVDTSNYPLVHLRPYLDITYFP